MSATNELEDGSRRDVGCDNGGFIARRVLRNQRPYGCGSPRLVRHMNARPSASAPASGSASVLVSIGYAAVLTLVLCLFVLGLTSRLDAQQLRTCFAPQHPGTQTCTAQIVSAIAAAHQLILVQAYGFTSAPIAKALVDAHRRGVDVRVILDKSNLKQGYSSAAFLQHMGIPALIDSNHAIAHNKVMVIDGREVVTGSFNFTKAAEEKNAENVVFIDDPATATAYAQNWKDHAAHSVVANLADQRGSVPREYADARSAAVSGVTGNRKSHIYQWPGCQTFGAIAPRNRVEFPNVQAAQAAGYRPAHNCP